MADSTALAARLQVAIKYSGVKDSQALPMVLVIRTGAVDRGACVRDFSQYVDEVEYLWLPGSFLEQVRVGPNNSSQNFWFKARGALLGLSLAVCI